MLTKRALSTNVELELLRPGDRVKTAGAMPEVQRVLDAVRPDPAYTFCLVNAMGYSEFYGTNSNADWYGYCPELNYNGLLHAWPDIGQNLETDRMKGKDWPYGYPCFYGAAVYAHHKNTDPVQLGFGDVQYVYANPIMKRVELLMRIHNEEARKKGHLNIVERIHAGERCDVSMGAKIPFDLCSICTDWDEVNKARRGFDANKHRHWGLAVLDYHKRVKPIRGLAVTAVDYCVHIRSQKNQVQPDGRKAFMYNVHPRFFDISCVFIGADRTARVMWHLADSFRDDAPIRSRPSSTPMRLARLGLEELFGKVANDKSAEMEKEIPDGYIEKVLTDSDTAPEVRFDLMKQDPKALLSSAAALGILLSPREFGRMLGGGSFATDSPEIDDGLAVSPRFVDNDLLSTLNRLAPERSAFKPFVEPRITTISARITLSHPMADPGSEKLAALYNGYRLSVLEQGEKLADRARGLLVDDPLGLKVASSGLAALLLGVAPVVHLLAAHLRQKEGEGEQLGTMTSFIANHPTFLSLAALAGAIRLGMITQGGGILSTAGKLLGVGTKA